MNDFLKEALSHDWIMKYITEFIGTALMVALGNGSVANVELKGTNWFWLWFCGNDASTYVW